MLADIRMLTISCFFRINEIGNLKESDISVHSDHNYEESSKKPTYTMVGRVWLWQVRVLAFAQ